MTQVPIRLVLDATAGVEFTRASIHLGEVLSEVADEGAVAHLPLTCLVEAVHSATHPDLEARAPILTTQPGWYSSLGNGGLVIKIGE